MTGGCPYKKGKFGDTHTHAHTGRMPGADEDRDLCDASSSQRMPKMASKPPEAGESPRKDPTLLAP